MNPVQIPRLAARALLVASLLTGSLAAASTKDTTLRGDPGPRKGTAGSQAQPAGNPGGSGHRLSLTNGSARVPVAVVRGTPYQMGWHLGRLMRDEIAGLAPAAVAGFKRELQITDEALDQAWATTAGHTDARIHQQLAGLAAGSGQPVRLLQHVHGQPLLMP